MKRPGRNLDTKANGSQASQTETAGNTQRSARCGLARARLLLAGLCIIMPAWAAEAAPGGSPQDPAGTAAAQDSDGADTSQADPASDDSGLPKFEDMQVPSPESLLRDPPVTWIVLVNQDVLVSEPIQPRPNTLEKMEQAIQESRSWPRPNNPAELAELRRKREELPYINLILKADDQEYNLHMREVDRIIHHEDLMLMAIDKLIAEGRLRDAYEMLVNLDQRAPNWPGTDQRQLDLLFRDAQLKVADGRDETALVLLEELESRQPSYPALFDLMGQVVDRLISQAVSQEDYRRARFFLDRLRARNAEHAVVQKWTNTLTSQAAELYESAMTASRSGQHEIAAELARQSGRVWPVPGSRRAGYSRVVERYQQLHVGVTQLYDDPSAYFLPTRAQQRHRYLTECTLFELDRNVEMPHFQTSFFEHWEPRDLGREVKLVLRRDHSYWESRPPMTSSMVVETLAARIDPEDERYDERLASYVDGLSIDSPYEFTVDFNRVPLRPQALFQFPVTERIRAGERTGELELLSKRFVVANQDDSQVVYRRAVPEPDGAPSYHIAEVIEHRYPDYEHTVQALLRQEVTLLTHVEPWHAERFLQDKRFFTRKYSVPFIHVLQVNPASKPLRNRELRRALAYAIDRERILRDVILRQDESRFGRLISGPFHQNSYAHSPLVSQREFDLTLGLSLGIVAKKALGGEIPKLRLICPPDAVSEQACQELIQLWKAIKIDVELVPNDGSVTIERDSENWDLIYRVTQMGEPLVELWPFLTLNDTARVEDLTHLPDWLRLELIELDNVSSWSAAIARLRQLHRHISEECHLIPLWEVDDFVVFWRTLSGLPDDPISAYQNIERWTLKP